MADQQAEPTQGMGNPMNPANIVTVTRVILIPLFLVAFLGDWPAMLDNAMWAIRWKPWIAAAVFALLAATDAVDGYLARSRNEVTTFGKFIDPLADKLLVTAALLALVEMREPGGSHSLLPGWIALIIISREFIVSGLRMVASAEGTVIAASWYGKIKTVLQIIAITMFIVKDSRTLDLLGVDFVAWFQAASWAIMGAAVIMTILSMVDYFRHAADVLIGPWTLRGARLSEIVALEQNASQDAEDETLD